MSIIIRDGTNAAQLATVDSNGNLHTLDGNSGTPGSAVPATAIQIAGSDGTNLRTIATDTTGRTVAVLNGARATLGVFSVQSTSSSPSSLIGSGSGYRDIITLILTNEGTATIVSISDGTTTYKFALGANLGININFSSTLPAKTSATAWTISNSASQTVDASGVYVNN